MQENKNKKKRIMKMEFPSSCWFRLYTDGDKMDFGLSVWSALLCCEWGISTPWIDQINKTNNFQLSGELNTEKEGKKWTKNVFFTKWKTQIN